jgi:ComF family protein
MLSLLDFLFGPAPRLVTLSTPPIVFDAEALRERRIRHLDTLAVACSYDAAPEVAKALKLLKYRGVRRMAGPLAELLVPCITALGPEWGSAVLCPVPLHWLRRWGRGFNQAHLLARLVARSAGRLYGDCLRRRRSTGSQAKRDGKERRAALTDAFEARSPLPQTIILIDDVCTTGSTLDACASALKRSGVAKVAAIAIALG